MLQILTRKSTLVLFAIIATLFGSRAMAQDTTASSEPKKPTTLPMRQLYVNGFRSPSIGLEYRTGAFSVHSGYYTTILSKTDASKHRSTQFVKTGFSYYFGGNARHEYFASAAHVRGLSDGWKKDGAFFELGSRWQVARQLELRLGAGLLMVPGHSARLNPTPGISFSIPLK